MPSYRLASFFYKIVLVHGPNSLTAADKLTEALGSSDGTLAELHLKTGTSITLASNIQCRGRTVLDVT